jgi:hypothetical protein
MPGTFTPEYPAQTPRSSLRNARHRPKFDCPNAGTTPAKREAAHRGELDNVNASLKSLRTLLDSFNPW